MALDLARMTASLVDGVAPLAALGYELGPLTQRDLGLAWPDRIVTEPTPAIAPDSIGILIEGPPAAGQLVMFDGGWADLVFVRLSSHDVVTETLWFSTDAEVDAAVARFVGLFRDLAED